MLAGLKTYRDSSDLTADLRNMLQRAQHNFLALGVSFDRTTRNLGNYLDEALQRGIAFTFIALSRNANLGIVAQRFGQTPDELTTEIEASYAVLEKYRRAFPSQFKMCST